MQVIAMVGSFFSVPPNPNSDPSQGSQQTEHGASNRNGGLLFSVPPQAAAQTDASSAPDTQMDIEQS